MRKIRPGAIAVVLGLALSNPLVATIAEPTVRRIPARLAAHRLLIVPVSVNGAGPFPFLLDTGATSSMVTEDLARELALPHVGPPRQWFRPRGGSPHRRGGRSRRSLTPAGDL